MCLVLLLVNVISVRAPAFPDSLSRDAEDAIARTYTLQAQLEQDSKDNPANAQANREKMSLLGQARTELARVYTTPLSTDGSDYTSGKKLDDGTAIADDSEFQRIYEARQTVIAGIPESSDRLGYGMILRERLATAREARSDAETGRTRWLAEPNASWSSEQRQYAQQRDAAREGIEAEIVTAQEELERTGKPERFIKAQRALQEHQDTYGPLKSVDSLTSSLEAEQTKKELLTLVRARQVLEDAIRTRTAGRESTDLHSANLLTLNAQLATAKYEMEKSQKTVEEKMLAQRKRVAAGKKTAAEQREEERTTLLSAEAFVETSARGALASARSAKLEEAGSARSGVRSVSLDETYEPTEFGTAFASTGSSRPSFEDEGSTVEDLIATRKRALQTEIERYKKLDDYTKTAEFKEWQSFYKQQLEDANTQLEKLQSDAERRLPNIAITNEAEIKKATAEEDARQQRAQLQLTQEKQTLLVRRNQAVEELRAMEDQQRAAMQLEQAKAELDELTTKERGLTHSFNPATKQYDIPKTPEQIAAAQEDLRRELLARDRFEEQVTTSELARLMATAENDARRAAAERLFAAIDASEVDEADADAAAAAEDDTRSGKRLSGTPPGSKASSVASFVGSRGDQDIPTGGGAEDLSRDSRRASVDSAGSSPDSVEAVKTRPRNIFLEAYAKEYESRRAAATIQAKSPLTRARLYKENPDVLAQVRQEVDWGMGAGSEDLDMKIKVLNAQKTKALEGKSRSNKADLVRIKEKNEAELNNLLQRARSIDPKATEEQARQLMVLYKAQAYYKAIEETVGELQRKFAEEQQAASQAAERIGAKIAQLEDDGEAVSEDLKREYDAALARIEAAKNKAATMIDAFKTDPVPFLTAKGQRVELDDLGEHLADPALRDKKYREGAEPEASEQLTIFRRALANNGIEFWREEDVTPEITNALNLLKRPEAVLNDEKQNVVRKAAEKMRLSVRNLGDAITSGDIAQSIAKALKKVDDYEAPPARSLKDTAALKEKTANTAAARSPEEARAIAETRIADYRTIGKSEPGDDLRDAPRSIAPIANLVILQSDTNEMIPHSERSVFLMTEEEAGKEIERRDLSSTKMVYVTLDLSDLSPEGVERQLKKSLFDGNFEPDAIEEAVGVILPRENPKALAAELAGLKLVKEQAVAAVQEKNRVLTLLAAKRKDAMFNIAVRDVNLENDDDEEEDDEGDDEDTVVLKKIKHFDLFKADYLKKIKNPDTPEDEIEEAHQKYHQYLSDLLDEAESEIQTRRDPLTRQNRELLLALSAEALEELERPNIRDFNEDDLVDTRKKTQSLALSHLDSVRAEDEEREREQANPSAAVKRTQIEAKQRKLDEDIREINRRLTAASTEEEIAQAYTQQQQLRSKFAEQSHKLVVEIRDDLETSIEDRIARLSEEAMRLRNQVKTQGSSTPEQAARLAELAELTQAEERVRVKIDPDEKAKRKQAKAEESEAVARRLTSRLSSARSGSSASSGADPDLAKELSSAGRSFRRDRKEEASARKSARPTPRQLGRVRQQ